MSVKERIEYVVDFTVETTGLEHFGDYITFMLEFDALILNEDRHLNNIGVIQKEDGTYAYSPIFDHGAAFLSDTNSFMLGEDTDQLIRKVKAKPFSANFEKQVETLRELYGTQLNISGDLDLTPCMDEIKNVYGNEITNRIHKVCAIQKAKHAELFTDVDSRVKENKKQGR